MNLSRPFVRRPVASIMIAVALVLVGALAYGLLPVSPLPQVDFPSIRVSASLPGASPDTMATTVASPLERALGAISGVHGIYSENRQGSTSITLEFALGRDLNAAARDVQAALNAARSELPAGMPSSPSFRKSNPAAAPIMALALSSPNLAPSVLYDFAATILGQKISQIDGVGEVQIGGASLPAVRVQLNPHALSHHGISLDEVRRAIAATNSIRPRGTVEDGPRQWEVQVSSQLRRAAEYESLIVRYRDGAPVRLGDVAKISDSMEDRYSMGFHNDRPAVLLNISRQPGANIIETIDAINAQLPGLRALLPADADLAVTMDRSPGIRATLHESQRTLLIATALVMLVVFLFLGDARASVIPCLAIPVSVVGTFSFMYLLGFSLNNFSLMALIVAAGLVVDDAIVVMENISRHIDRGLSPLRATLLGAREVGFTLLAMNLSLVAVFVSILFMGGLVERLFREFSITLVIAMGVSLAVSLTLVPALCARWLKPAHAPHAGGFLHATERAFEGIKSIYARSLGWVLNHATLTLIVLLGTIALNVSLYLKLPKGFLPMQDTGTLHAFARGDDAFSYQVMQPKIEIYRRIIMADPAVQDVIGTSGGTSGINNAKMTVRLKPLAERKVSATDVANRIRAAAPPTAGSSLYLYGAQDIDGPRMSDNTSYDLSILSSELELIRQWAPRIGAALQDLPELTDVDARSEAGAQVLRLQIDREAARRLGVDMQMVSQVLNSSFSQRPVATLYDRLNQYRVIMELEPQYTSDPVVLDKVTVIGANGTRVPLSAFTRHAYAQTEDRVRHRAQFAAESVGFGLAEGVSLEQGLAAIDQALAKILLPSTVQARMLGSFSSFQTSIQTQPLLILGVLVAVYLVLGILYESLVHPLTILSTLPSAGLGAFLALKLTGTEFSLIALLGLFLLIGIVMKNAILMIDFAIDMERRTGASPRDSIYEAARMRLRPILMTNFAALLGALPLVLATGEGVEMRQPLGLAIVGGLMVSQVLTLYTVPVVYLWLDRLRLWGQGLRRKPAAA
ncbi:MAG: efflux RND transporter permease subunit [Opitutaceae bacterium]|nr:efflux RND transporter permease subunit [Opitutaceae bacterium]